MPPQFVPRYVSVVSGDEYDLFKHQAPGLVIYSNINGEFPPRKLPRADFDDLVIASQQCGKFSEDLIPPSLSDVNSASLRKYVYEVLDQKPIKLSSVAAKIYYKISDAALKGFTVVEDGDLMHFQSSQTPNQSFALSGPELTQLIGPNYQNFYDSVGQLRYKYSVNGWQAGVELISKFHFWLVQFFPDDGL